MTLRSRDLQPGDVLVSTTQTPEARFTLGRRKDPADVRSGPWHPGWWVTDGGGFADFVLDDSFRRGEYTVERDGQPLACSCRIDPTMLTDHGGGLRVRQPAELMRFHRNDNGDLIITIPNSTKVEDILALIFGARLQP